MALSFDVEKDELFQQGMEKGLEEGLEKGLEEGKLQAIAQLLKDGSLSKEKIAQVMGVSLEEINKITQNIQ